MCGHGGKGVQKIHSGAYTEKHTHTDYLQLTLPHGYCEGVGHYGVYIF